jgi:hypothetical protein
LAGTSTTTYSTADSLVALHTACASTTSSTIGEHPFASTIAAFADITFLYREATITAALTTWALSIVVIVLATSSRSGTSKSATEPLGALSDSLAYATSLIVAECSLTNTIAAYADVAFLGSNARITAALTSVGEGTATATTAGYSTADSLLAVDDRLRGTTSLIVDKLSRARASSITFADTAFSGSYSSTASSLGRISNYSTRTTSNSVSGTS